MSDVVARLIPLILLLSVGALTRRIGLLDDRGVGALRNLVVNVALPSVLFVAFLETTIEAGDIGVVVGVFAFCVALYGVGLLLRRSVGGGRDYFPFLMTGFEAGMLGISLFGSVFGVAAIGTFAVVALGHEFFIWFAFLALLLRKRDGAGSAADLAKAFFSNPAIVAILLGIAGSMLGLDESMEGPIWEGLLGTLGFLGAMTVPLILLIVGHGIRFDVAGLREAAPTVLVRSVILMPLAVLAAWGASALGADPLTQAAVFTLLILPPPFIVPLYMPEGHTERAYVTTTLSAYTLVTVAAFVSYALVVGV